MPQQASFDFHETALDAARAAVELIACKLDQIPYAEIARACWSPAQIYCANCACDRAQIERERESSGYDVACCDDDANDA